MNVTCSHITFVGKGNDQTTIQGGFCVFDQQDVKFEELAITNPRGSGVTLLGSHVEVSRCVLRCVQEKSAGIRLFDESTVVATQCEFMENGAWGVFCCEANTKARLNDCTMHDNGQAGLFVANYAVVDLHGTKTDIHSNGRGIFAVSRAKVNIHLPSQHNTSHDNVGEDRHQQGGALYSANGSIANMNAEGTFTHVIGEIIVDTDGDEDWYIV
tara:strand:- start:1160 stop:1798 length:639 start_codon:yes stop_codon:yes gene_type:complete